MATDESKERDEAEDEAQEAESTDESRPEEESKSESADEKSDEKPAADESDRESDDEPLLGNADEPSSEAVEMPAQLGHTRFVYAAYLAAGIAIAFVSHKILDYAWYKLHDWKPDALPEQQDEISVPIAVALAIAVALYTWRDMRIRVLVEEVAEELTKVTWPSRQEVTSSTTVVIITTLLATVFFALMDQFWLWVTKHVYGS